MIWFIATEVMFFAAFFGALFYMRVISVPELGNMMSDHGTSLWPDFAGTWPTSGPKGTAVHADGRRGASRRSTRPCC